MNNRAESLIHKIAVCSDHFFKIAGIHQGPPELYKDIEQFIVKIYANHILGLIIENLIRTSPQDLAELKKEVIKYADKPRAYKSRIQTEIPINLDNWHPYEQLSKKHSFNLKKLKLIIDFQGHATRQGVARPGEIEIDMTLIPRTARGFHQSLDRYKIIARHEVAHQGQFIINSILKKYNIGGMPSKKLYTPESILKKHEKSEKERLKDTEFYTYLGDAVDEYKSKVEILSPEQRNDLAKYLVALKPFSPIKTYTDAQIYFQTLRKYAPDKWRKAVKEFFKAIGPELKEYQEKRKGEIPGERTESIWSAGRMMKAVQDYNKLLAKDPNSKETKDLLKALEYQDSLRQRVAR
jgi:uncharacterized protein YqeY